MARKMSVTTTVLGSPYGLQFLMRVGQQLRSDFARGLLVDYAGHWRYLPKGDYPVVPFSPVHWRPYVGGLLVYTRVPKLDGTGDEADRIALVFDDPSAARRVHVLQREAIRSTAFLKYVDGRWYAVLKFKSKDGMVLRAGKSRHQYWQRKTQLPRWHKAPEGWPRDKYGRPFTERQMKIRGLWPFVPSTSTE